MVPAEQWVNTYAGTSAWVTCFRAHAVTAELSMINLKKLGYKFLGKNKAPFF